MATIMGITLMSHMEQVFLLILGYLLCCSFHISPKKHWFREYKSLDDGSVLMGNNASCKTPGIGITKMKMFDGIIRTLIKVRHVSDLRKNLISLHYLDAIVVRSTRVVV